MKKASCTIIFSILFCGSVLAQLVGSHTYPLYHWGQVGHPTVARSDNSLASWVRAIGDEWPDVWYLRFGADGEVIRGLAYRMTGNDYPRAAARMGGMDILHMLQVSPVYNELLLVLDEEGSVINTWRLPFNSKPMLVKLQNAGEDAILLTQHFEEDTLTSHIIELDGTTAPTFAIVYTASDLGGFRANDVISVNDTLLVCGLSGSAGYLMPYIHRIHPGGQDGFTIGANGNWMGISWLKVDDGYILLLDGPSTTAVVQLDHLFNVVDAVQFNVRIRKSLSAGNGIWLTSVQQPGMNSAIVAFQDLQPLWSHWVPGDNGELVQTSEQGFAYVAGIMYPLELKVTRFLIDPEFCDPSATITLPEVQPINVTIMPMLVDHSIEVLETVLIDVLEEEVPVAVNEDCVGQVGLQEGIMHTTLKCGYDVVSDKIIIPRYTDRSELSTFILDIQGRSVSAAWIEQGEDHLIISAREDLNAGIYLISLRTDQGVIRACRFVKPE